MVAEQKLTFSEYVLAAVVRLRFMKLFINNGGRKYVH